MARILESGKCVLCAVTFLLIRTLDQVLCRLLFSHADSLNRIIIPAKMQFESVLEQQRHAIRVRHICSTARNQ